MQRQPAPNLTQLAGFVIERVIGRGATSTVYQARKGPQRFALKVMEHDVTDAASAESGLWFRREAAAVGRVNHPSIVRIVEAGEAEASSYLAMELVEGESLADAIARGPLPEQRWVEIAHALAGALDEVHRRGMVHCDVKPDNILLRKDGVPCLIDFGFVTDAETEKRGFVGTVDYAPPEATGMLQRPVDGRSDLYSLGVTLFQAATGKLPFTGDSAGDVMQKHAAVEAPTLRQAGADYRPSLSAICAKLLAKDPDDRYQAGRGLRADLERLADLDEACRAGETPALDVSDGLSSGADIPLVGRERELWVLKMLWGQVEGGVGAYTLVEGGGGIGKTRLVRELLTLARERQGHVMKGKCRLEESVPFGVLREAIDGFVAGLATMPVETRDEARAALRAAAEGYIGTLKHFARSLAGLLSEDDRSAALDPETEGERFDDIIAGFFANLARQLGPTVILVDDVQWLDDSSLRVLGLLAQRIDSAPLMIVGTSRDDSSSQAALKRFHEAVGDALRERIQLQPLGSQAVSDLIAAHLGGRPLERSAVERLATLARGNPFSLGEYVRALVDAGAVRPTAAGWSLTDGSLTELALPSDVIELVVGRLHTLRAETGPIISVAGLLGTTFKLDLLTEVVGDREERVHAALQEAVQAGLLERPEALVFGFVHDRVQEAAIARLSEAEQRDIHQRIAEVLDARSDGSPSFLYSLSRHYLAGHIRKNPQRAFRAAVAAGRLALESHANHEAHLMLTEALRVASETSLPEDDQAEVWEPLGIACTRVGRVADAYGFLEKALPYASSREDKARIHLLISAAYAGEGRMNPEAWGALEKAFRVFGRPYPRSFVVRMVTMNLYWFASIFMSLFRIGFGSSKGKARERRVLLSQMHRTGVDIALMQGDALLVTQLVMRDMLNTHFLGTSREWALTHSLYAALMGLMGLRFITHRQGRLSVQVGEQLGDPAVTAIAKLYYAIGLEWSGDDEASDPMQLEALPIARKYASAYYVAFFTTAFAHKRMFAGKVRESIDFIQAALPAQHRTGHIIMRANLLGCLHASLVIAGRNAEAVEVRREWMEIVDRYFHLAWVQEGYYAHAPLISSLVTGDYTDFEEGVRFYRMGLITYMDYWMNVLHSWTVHGRAALYENAPPDKRAARRKECASALRRFRTKLLTPLALGHYRIASAAMARIDGKLGKARRLLDKVRPVVDDNDWPALSWFYEREMAGLCAAAGDFPNARQHAQRAIDISELEGWFISHVPLLRKTYQLEGGTSDERSLGASSLSERSGKTSAQRYMDALLEVSLATGTLIKVDDQARAALAALIRVLGAERGFFFLNDEDTGELRLTCSLGADGKPLNAVTNYSTTVVQRASEERRPFVVMGSEDGELLGSQSAVVHGLRSIIAAPIMLRDTFVGVLYLDNSMAAGVFNAEHVKLLFAMGNHIAIAVQSARAAQHEVERKTLEKDLALTGAVQSLLVPKKPTLTTDRFELAGYYQPATHCGGDWWWYEQRPDGSILILVGDVTGHGAGPAMVTAAVAGSFQMLRNQPLTGAQILTTINEMLLSFSSTYFMTMSAIEVNPADGKVRWSNAGGPALMIQRDSGNVEVLTAPGSRLGEPKVSFGVEETTLRRGDRMFQGTDGVFEITLPKGRELGMRGVGKILDSLADVGCKQARTRLARELDRLHVGTVFEDDVTFVLFELI